MNENLTKEEKKEQRKITISLVLIIIGLLALLVAVYFHLFYQPKQPDYNIPEVDINVVELDKVQKPEGLDTDASGGFAAVTYSKNIDIDLNEKTARFIFQNPSSSGSLMKIAIDVEGTEIATSGIINPGYGIDHFSGIITDGLKTGEYKGNIVVDHYNPDSGEKAILSLRIPVDVTISK